jgi:ABC-type transporter Mla subunit MlaD
MSLEEKKEEAEAILDSAEMLLETFGGTGQTANELRGKIAELEQELQDPESEQKLDELISEIRELMDELQDQPATDDMGGMGEDELGPEEPGGMGPDPDGGAPPF